MNIMTMKSMTMNVVRGCPSLGASVLLALFVLHPGVAIARDDVQDYSVGEAMATKTAELFTGVDFFFGDSAHPKIKRAIGAYTSKKITNAFGKSDHKACQWAFLSAIKSLYERALREGGNAVINIRSITTGVTIKSEDNFVCRAGGFVAKVYLEGEVVSLGG